MRKIMKSTWVLGRCARWVSGFQRWGEWVLITRANLFSPQNLNEVNPYLSLGLQTKNLCGSVWKCLLDRWGWGGKWERGTGKGKEGEGDIQECNISKVLLFRKLASFQGTLEIVVLKGCSSDQPLASPGNFLELQSIRPYLLNENFWGGA